MTIVFERSLANGEKGAHALVIGVGSYPHLAAPGAPPPDLDSAAAGARMFADWLISHADALRPRVASIDLVISPPGEATGSYAWPAGATIQGALDPRADQTVERAIKTNVAAAGVRWHKACRAQAGNVPVLYLCGHGVATPSRTMVLLADVRQDPQENWSPFIDVQVEATRIRRESQVPMAYMFVDACQEVITEVDLAEQDPRSLMEGRVKLWQTKGDADSDRSNVYALVPGPRGALAFDDGIGGGGRFTHILVQALSGAAVKNHDGMGTWGVIVEDLHPKMRALYSLRPQWTAKPMEPTPIYMPVAEYPIVEFASAPRVPICLNVKPSDALRKVNELVLRTRAVAANPDDDADIVYRTGLLIENAPPLPGKAARTAELLIAWPNVATGAHFVQVGFDGAPSWPGGKRRTPVDISEMRLRIVHDVG